MDESTASPQEARSAGAMLREARQAQGLHIAALAASIKVAQKKLEALEADRVDELPDATFARALAQTVCRALKIDPAPILARLPAPAGYRLEHVGEGINAPFRDRSARHDGGDWGLAASPVTWGVLLLVLGSVVLYLLPAGWLSRLQFSPAASSASHAIQTTPSTDASPAMPAPATVAAPPVQPAVPADSEPAAVAPATAEGPQAPASEAMAPAAAVPSAVPTAAPSAAPTAAPLQLHAKAQSWIEVQDGRSRVLLSRMLEPGETVALDGDSPFHLTIGNAGGTEVTYRGQPVDLANRTRDNVARIELK